MSMLGSIWLWQKVNSKQEARLEYALKRINQEGPLTLSVLRLVSDFRLSRASGSPAEPEGS